MYSDQHVISQCKQWLDKIIIELNFCPFAKKEFVNNTIAYPIARNVDIELALIELVNQCQYLDQHPDISTALLIFPENFSYFEDYLDLVELAEPLIFKQGYEGTYQIATFHPDYYFDGVDEDDVSNYTNRSPFPLLHIIREADLERAVKAHPDPEGIPDKNIQVCHKKGINFFKSFMLTLKKQN